MLKFFFIFSIFISHFLTLHVQATPIPPSKTPKTLHTQHFEIVYYAEQQDLAYHYAVQLEKAWLFLDGIFKSKPQGRIIAVINDSTDLSNGFATRVPYPYMMLYPVLPDLNDSLSEFEYWSLELAVHELAHVLSFEPAHGVMKPLRSVFGSIIAPNLLLPNWWKEGLSVWTETAIGNGGRLRSIYQEGTLRGIYGEKSFKDYTVAQANEALPEWPWGSRPYLFGSLVMSSILEKRGEEVMKDIVERHGGRVPFMLAGATQPTLGQDYEDFYVVSMKDWEERTAKQVQQLSQVPFDQSIQVYTNDINVRSPSISHDGKFLTWVGQDERYEPRLKVSSLDNGNLGPVEEVAKGMIREARFFPKSHRIIYNVVKYKSQAELYSDLYVYDLATKKNKRLSRHLRGREAQVNPEETQIVFVGVEGGKTQLRMMDFNTDKATTLFSTKFDERIASPLFLDSNRILFSWTQQGKEALHVFDLTTKQTTLFANDSTRIRRPLQTQGELFYMSDKNRVFNVYSHQSKKALTHVKSTVIDYAIHPDKNSMYAVLMTAQGPQLHYFPDLAKANSRPALPKADPLVKQHTVLKVPSLDNVEVQEAPRSYMLWPHYWIPFIAGSSAEDGVLLSISTNGQDPTLQHAYQASLTYDTGVEELSYGVAYSNRAWTTPWSLSSSRMARNFASSEDPYYNQSHAISIVPDTSAITENWGTTLSYLYAKYEDDNRTYERHGPNLNLGYSNVHQTLFMISPEEGYEAAVNWTHFLKSTNLDAYNQYRLKGSFYWSKWLPERHVISVETRALVTDERIPSILGDSSTVYASPLTSNYLIRGYLEGQFTGRNITNANVEFRFPIHSFTEGNGTFPFYVKRIHGAAAFDALSVDGFAYKEPIERDVRVEQDTVFSSAGAEIRADTTVGYILPIQWVGGIHYPLQKSYKKEATVLLQIRSSFDF